VVKLSFLASIAVAAIGIGEEFLSPVRDFVLTYYPPPEVQQNLRISSTLQFYNGLGAYLIFTMILALAYFTVPTRLKIAPLLLCLTILADSTALILTGTLAAWIGMVVGTLLIFMTIRRVPKAVILAVIGVVLAAFFFQPFLSVRLDQQLGAGAAQGIVPQTLVTRMQLWQEIFLPAVSQHLFFGWGPDPAILNLWPTEETEYLRLLVRGGIFSLLSYILVIVVAIRVCRRHMTKRSADASRVVAIATFSILITLNVMNISGEYFTFAGPTQTLWTLLAMVVATVQCRSLDLVPPQQGRGAS
jgi:O-antigen ligase